LSSTFVIFSSATLAAASLAAGHTAAGQVAAVPVVISQQADTGSSQQDELLLTLGITTLPGQQCEPDPSCTNEYPANATAIETTSAANNLESMNSSFEK
jgi:hypothetical protein